MARNAEARRRQRQNKSARKTVERINNATSVDELMRAYTPAMRLEFVKHFESVDAKVSTLEGSTIQVASTQTRKTTRAIKEYVPTPESATQVTPTQTQTSSTTPNKSTPTFMTLPPELRLHIYECIFTKNSRPQITIDPRKGGYRRGNPNILGVNKQIRDEALPLLYQVAECSAMWLPSTAPQNPLFSHIRRLSVLITVSLFRAGDRPPSFPTMAEVELKLLRARARKIDVLVRCLPEEGEYAPIHYFGLDDEEAEELELRYPSGWRPVPYSKKFVTRLGKGSSQALDESCRSTLRAMDGECLDGLALIALASAFMTLDLRCRVEIPEGAPEIWRKEPAETWIEAEYSMTPDNGECVATDTTRVVEPEELANRPAENWLARCWE